MSALPAITEAGIRARTGETSFARGQEYFRSGAIFDTRRQGRTLKAQCAGTSAPSYRLWVTFDEQGIAGADCSCPVGGGGGCKHTAALLLTWLDRPEAFVEVEEVDLALARRSKEELITLVKHMVRRRPELEVLLETPLPAGAPTGTLSGAASGAPAEGGVARAQNRKPVDSEVYRRQARAVFRGLDYDDAYGAQAGVVDELNAITEIGDGFAAQGDYASAAAVYQAVADAVIENYELFHDDGGELASVASECVEGLGACLQQTPEGDPVRQTILKCLFDVYRADIESGGVGLGDQTPVLLVEHTTPAERQLVAQWVREALPPDATPEAARTSAGTQATAWTSNWRRQAFGGLLLSLESLDDESYLRVCRQTGRVQDLVDRLLVLGRIEEAAREVHAVPDHEVLRLAEVFERHGEGDVMERLVQQRVQERPRQDTSGPHGSALQAWLKERYKQRGDLLAALTIAEDLFVNGPSLPAYRELRDLAQPLGRWEQLGPQLLRQLEDTHQQALLIQIALDDGQIDRALDLTQANRQPVSLYGHAYHAGTSLHLRVALAAEESRPRAAIDVYRDHVARLIAQRGRPAYHDAAKLLPRVRALYERLGEAETWDRYIADLRNSNRALSALRDELARAGL